MYTTWSLEFLCKHFVIRTWSETLFISLKMLVCLRVRGCETQQASLCSEVSGLCLTSTSFVPRPTYQLPWLRFRSLRPLACWDRGFESHRGHGYLSVVSVACCQVEVSATSWSLVQRSPTDCGASLCVIQKNKPLEWGGQEPLWGYRVKRKKNSRQLLGQYPN
jgi:hypothetical protein